MERHKKKDRAKLLQNFVMEKFLGKGSFGQVYRVKRKSVDQVYVAKEIDIKPLPKAERKMALDEIRLLASVSHPGVVRELARLSADRGDPQEALRLISSAVELAPRSVDVLLDATRIALAARRPPIALQAWQRAVALDPTVVRRAPGLAKRIAALTANRTDSSVP